MQGLRLTVGVAVELTLRERGGEARGELGVSGHGEAWAFWSSGKYLIKVGGRGLAKVPGDLVQGYGERYPSSVKAGSLDAADADEADAPAPKKKGKGS